MSRQSRVNVWPTKELKPHPLNSKLYGDDLKEGIEPLLESVEEHGMLAKVEILPEPTVTSWGQRIPAGTIIKHHRCWMTNLIRDVKRTEVIERWDLINDPSKAELELLLDDDPRTKRHQTDAQKVARINEIRRLTGKSMGEVAEELDIPKPTIVRAAQIEKAAEVGHPEDVETVQEILEEQGIRPAAEAAKKVIEKNTKTDGEPRATPVRALNEVRTQRAERAQEREDSRPDPGNPMKEGGRILMEIKDTILGDAIGRKLNRLSAIMQDNGESDFAVTFAKWIERGQAIIQDHYDATFT